MPTANMLSVLQQPLPPHLPLFDLFAPPSIPTPKQKKLKIDPNSPHLGLKNPSSNILLFFDPRFKPAVEKFFAGAQPNESRPIKPKRKSRARGLIDPSELIVPYNPAVDDLQVLRERLAPAETVRQGDAAGDTSATI